MVGVGEGVGEGVGDGVGLGVGDALTVEGAVGWGAAVVLAAVEPHPAAVSATAKLTTAITAALRRQTPARTLCTAWTLEGPAP
jgi:hypothetical protein